jgi:hypothetical protein
MSIHSEREIDLVRHVQSQELRMWFRRRARRRKSLAPGGDWESSARPAMINLKVAQATEEFWISLESTR